MRGDTIFRREEYEIRSNGMPNGTNDCGLFSIANALAACLGEEPSTIIWD